MDEFDRTNPFGEEFRPDALAPAPPPPPPFQYDDDGGDFPQPPPSLEEKSTRKEWGMPGPVEPEYPNESTLLQTVNQLITKYRNDPFYRVKSKESQLYGYSVEDLKKIRDGILEKRRATQPLLKQLQQGKQSLKATPPRKSKESPPTSLEKAVMSRRPVFEPSDDDEDLPEQDWETEGSGIGSVDKLIHHLYVSLGSIKAGNSSLKLKKQVFSLLDSLAELGTINKKQKKKIVRDYIDK